MDLIQRTLDNTSFCVCAMRDPDCVMQLMTTYDTNHSIRDGKISIINGKKITFKHPELVYNHTWYRHTVNCHNNR